MLKEFRSLGVFAAFSRWSTDISIHALPYVDGGRPAK